MSKKTKNTAVLVTPLAKPEHLFDIDADFIGVDAGWQIIEKAHKPVRFAIGDFDTGSAPSSTVDFEIFPVRKDETDLQLALQRVIDLGYEKIIVLGALSGRLDHTYASLRMICWDFPQAVLMDEKQKAYVLTEGKHTITDAFRHVSFFACEDSIVSLRGFEYDGNNLKMGARQYYGVSNALKCQSASIDVLKGKVLCIESGWN